VPLKHALRALYKKVHPDLFHEYPEEKAENEKSFKLLQVGCRVGCRAAAVISTSMQTISREIHQRPCSTINPFILR
jgi:hypothetical protein